MTRNRVADWTALENEYVYAPVSAPVSISDLSEKYGIARSGVARHAQVGEWTRKRREFAGQVGDGVREALAEKWAKIQTDHQEKLLRAGSAYLDLWVEKLNNGSIDVSTKDALAVAAMMRTEFEAIRDDATKPFVVDGDGNEVVMDEEEARASIAQLKALMAGRPEAVGE